MAGDTSSEAATPAAEAATPAAEAATPATTVAAISPEAAIPAPAVAATSPEAATSSPEAGGTSFPAPGLMDALRTFRDERDWAPFHRHKDLACAISVEAAELLDAFRWSGADTGVGGREQAVRQELADVMIYCLYLADAVGADPSALIAEKLAIDAARYPVAKARGTSAKYTEL